MSDESQRRLVEDRTKLIGRLDSPADSNWDDSWLAELDRRVEATEQSGHGGSNWVSARRRILAQLAG